jgi:hypothetical protein
MYVPDAVIINLRFKIVVSPPPPLRPIMSCPVGSLLVLPTTVEIQVGSRRRYSRRGNHIDREQK